MPQRLKPVLALAGVIGLTICSGVGLAQQGSRSITCTEVALTQKPGWSISGSWASDGSLFLVDALHRAIQRYSVSGKALGPIGGPLGETLRDAYPVSGKARGSSLILQVTDGLMAVGPDYRPTLPKSIRVEGAKRREPLAIGALWQWEPVGQRDIMGFGDVHGAKPDDRRNWYSAFLRFPLDDPSAFRVLRPLGLDDDETNLLRLGFPYIAAIGDTGYILSMGNKMALLKNEVNSDKLESLSALPPGLDYLPSKLSTQFESWKDYVSTMAGVEKAKLPVGLYAWNGSLYILSRAPDGKGTRWTLSSIDPVLDQYTGSVDLPIHANHVLVIPGPQAWAFVEKGPVLGKGLQEVSRVLFVPTKRLQAPLSRNGAGCSQ
jgi:hypothetical protein